MTGDGRSCYSRLSGDGGRESAAESLRSRTVSRSSGYYGSREYKDEGRSDARSASNLSPITTDGEDEPDAEEYQQRMETATTLMEEASARSLQTLHETLFVGTGTSEELDRQARVMRRVETELDTIGDNLHESRRHMRQVKSMFGGVGNLFARRKQVSAETCAGPTNASASASQGKKSSGPPPGKSKQEGAEAAGKKSGKSKAGKKVGEASPSSAESSSPDKSSGEGSSHDHGPPRGTGIEAVDRNMDGMERALGHLKEVGRTISVQLKDSDGQIGRVRVKHLHNTAKMKKLNREIALQG